QTHAADARLVAQPIGAAHALGWLGAGPTRSGEHHRPGGAAARRSCRAAAQRRGAAPALAPRATQYRYGTPPAAIAEDRARTARSTLARVVAASQRRDRPLAPAPARADRQRRRAAPRF